MSKNIAYVGPAPNQQALPAIDWLIGKGKKRYMLIGSDYVYPKVTNRIIRYRLNELSCHISSEHYAALGATDFSAAIEAIKNEKPEAIVLTIVGFESNRSFLEQIDKAGLSKTQTLFVSLVLSEDDLISLPAHHIENICTVFSYFQNIDDPINDDFVRRFKNIFGVNRRVGGYMESAYTGVRLWAKAVQKAGSFEPDRIMEAMKGISYYAPGGTVYFDEENNHVWRHSRVAQVDSNREYKVLWTSKSPLRPEPYPTSIRGVNWDAVLEEIQTEYSGHWEKPVPVN